jgi:hypothetical protein
MYYPRMRYPRSILIVLIAAAGACSSVWAQPDAEPADDPVAQEQARIDRYLHAYKAALAKADRQAAGSALEQVVDTTDQLIDAHRDHVQRPIWQTQLAEQLLYEQLRVVHQQADAFYEFGVPTRRQAQVFEAVAVRALELLEDAESTLFKLQGELPRQPDHAAKRVNTGLWDRMINQFYEVRTPYALARAAYYTALLPDDSSYYQKLGDDPDAPPQANSIAAERARLLALAVERLVALLIDQKAAAQDIELSCRSLLGRALLAQGETTEAARHLRRATGLESGDFEQLLAHLALAAVEQRAGNHSAAFAVLSQQRDTPMVSTNLLLRLLVADATHRLKLQTAAHGEQPLAEAYAPYIKLMADPSLGDAAEPLRRYIYQRWAHSIDTETDIEQMPAIVVVAIAQSLRADAQALMHEPARKKLLSAVEVCTALLERDNLQPRLRAEAIYNRALSVCLLDRDDPQRRIESAMTLIDLAEQFDDVPIAVDAIAVAVAGILQPMHAVPDPQANVEAAYQRGIDLLLNKFADTAAAHHQRLYYAIRILLPAKAYLAAAEVLQAVPTAHGDYFQAQRHRLEAKLALLETPRDPGHAALVEAAKRLRSEAGQAGDPSTRYVAANAAGHAELLLAELAVRAGQFDAATAMLNRLEQTASDDAELIRAVRTKRIVLRVQAGRFGQAISEAQQIMANFPDQAAELIGVVLTDLVSQADELRLQAADTGVTVLKDEFTERALGIARTAAALAQLLVDWAQRQGSSAEQMLAYKLLLAMSQRLAGDVAAAVAVVEPLLATYADDAEVIHQAAEAYFALGTQPALVKATALYTRLIEGLPTQRDGSYPPRYYNAYMRYLQICDKQKRLTGDIALTVRQLQLSDPDLGGEPYKSELERLLGKYMR